MWLALVVACTKVETDTDTRPAIVDLAAGFQSACIVFEDGVIECRGLPGELPRLEQVTKVDGHYFHYCATTNLGVECFGQDTHGETIAPNLTFDQVSVGTSLTCGITNTGVTQCWGDNTEGQ